MATEYFTLTDSAAIVSKRFRVIHSGYKPVISKRQNIEDTIGGGLDVSVGSLYRVDTYIVVVRYVEPETDYGSLPDLLYFYSLNNPTPTSGSAGNLITLTDHFGETHSVYIGGDHAPEPLSVSIDNENAWYYVPLELIFVPESP